MSGEKCNINARKLVTCGPSTGAAGRSEPRRQAVGRVRPAPARGHTAWRAFLALGGRAPRDWPPGRSSDAALERASQMPYPGPVVAQQRAGRLLDLEVV